MLKVDQATLEHMEAGYPGILQEIRYFEGAELPPCSHCGSTECADVQCGVIGCMINIAAAITKFKLIANGPKLGNFFCNACTRFFG